MTAPTVPSPTFRWDRLTVASALGYCLLAAGLGIGVVLGELRNEFGISSTISALHGSMFGFGLIVVGVKGVAIVDRVGRGRALRAAAAAVVGGVLLFCVGPTWQVTLLGTVLSGAGGALFVMVIPGVIIDHHGEHRATAFAAVSGAPGAIGVALSLAIGGAIGLGWSWRVPYLAITAMIAITLFVAARPVYLPVRRRHGDFTLGHFRRREVLVPWLFIVNAVLTEFAVGVWAATYLKEVGGASGGTAAALAGAFGVMMFVSRLSMPTIVRCFGPATASLAFVTVGTGALMMCVLPGLPAKVLGLVVVGFGSGPLYPLTLDRLSTDAGATVDSVSLGAIGALASGTAVIVGPLVLGMLADTVGLRYALLLVPTLAGVGALTQRPIAR